MSDIEKNWDATAIAMALRSQMKRIHEPGLGQGVEYRPGPGDTILRIFPEAGAIEIQTTETIIRRFNLQPPQINDFDVFFMGQAPGNSSRLAFDSTYCVISDSGRFAALNAEKAWLIDPTTRPHSLHPNPKYVSRTRTGHVKVEEIAKVCAFPTFTTLDEKRMVGVIPAELPSDQGGQKRNLVMFHGLANKYSQIIKPGDYIDYKGTIRQSKIHGRNGDIPIEEVHISKVVGVY